MRNRHGSYAIYRRILAAGVRSSGGTRIRSFSGECAPHQEPAGEEIGRTGVPMADEAAHLWTAQQLLSSNEEICVLRTYWRQRDEHVKAASAVIQRMQKVLTEMNVQIANVISDISGVTGMAILDAILTGERDRYQLADLANPRIQASKEEIARSLEGQLAARVVIRFAAATGPLPRVSKAHGRMR